MSDAPAQPPASTEGGINVTASDSTLNISGDVIGRDKITNVQNVYNVSLADGAMVGQGLAALKDLLGHSADARQAVTAFQTDFTASSEQLNILGDYKLLHDLLHRLQFNCFSPITQEARRFPDDEQAVENLNLQIVTLEGFAEELKTIASRPTLPEQETAWGTDLAAIRADLTAALDALDAAPLKKVTGRLNRILSTRPARVNASLIQAARTLRLPTLVAALTQVAASLNAADLDAEKIGALQTGVQTLDQLNTQLEGLVNDHDHWQGLDVELRQLESSIEKDMSELEWLWPDLKPKAEPLYAALADDWAAALRKDSAGLDEALAANSPPKIKRSFNSFRRRVSERFYRVDVNLKLLCETLRTVGGPLASVLKVIE